MNNKVTSTMITFLLVIALVGVSTISPTISLSENLHTLGSGGVRIRVLLLYDDSYESIMKDRGYTDTNSLENRLRQLTDLIALPYLQSKGIVLEFAISDYSSVLGDEYSIQCPVGNGLRTEENGVVKWIRKGQCTCPVSGNNCNPSPNGQGHHNNLIPLLNSAIQYAENSTEYDFVTVITGLTMCYTQANGEHMRCAGVTYGQSCKALVMNGVYDIEYGNIENASSAEVRFLLSNLISNYTLFWHEFTHVSGSPEGQCVDVNHACALSGSYNGIVYVRNPWCSNCENRFDLSELYAPESSENTYEQLQLIEENAIKTFVNIDDYIEYMSATDEEICEASQHNHDNVAEYCLPSDIPNGYAIDSVTVGKDGDVTFTLSRKKWDIDISMNERELLALYSTIRVKVCGYGQITDHTTFAESLAYAINAHETQTSNLYVGEVFANFKIGETTTRVKAGTQVVTLKQLNNGNSVTCYIYAPSSYSEDINVILELLDLKWYTVSAAGNEIE